MLKTTSKFAKRILALALSGVMIVSSLTTSGLTAYAAEETCNTPSGYCKVSSDFDEDNEDIQIEEAEENEGNKDVEEKAESEGPAKTETIETKTPDTESVKEESVKTEPVKEVSDDKESAQEVSDDADTDSDTEKEEVQSTQDEDKEQDEKAEEVKAYAYVAPSASAKSTVWANYEVFRGSVFGYSSQTVTDTSQYTLKKDSDSTMRIVTKGGNKIAGNKITETSSAPGDDGRAMYFYQLPINSPFILKTTAKINSIGGDGKNDSQAGFGLMARDDMLIDVKYDEVIHTGGEGYSSDYVTAGILMGSTATDSVLTTSTNGFSRENGLLNRGEALDGDKIVAAGETYDLSITFDGTKYTCQINDYPEKEYTVSLNNIDSKYQYIGMFAARKADISFSKIYLEVDGERILDQVSTRYNVTVEKEGNGTASADSTNVIAGDTVTLTAKPGKGYYLDGWQIVEGDNLVTNFEIDDNNQFTMPEGNVSVKAIFKEVPTKWDFENDVTIAGEKGILIEEGKTGSVAGLKINATTGKFDSTDSLGKGAVLGKGTTITVPLAGESTLTVLGTDTNYTVDKAAAETAEDSFTCGGIFLKTAVITATEDTMIKCITVTRSGNEEIELPETQRKIDVWDFGAKEQSGSNYVNHIKAADWNNCSVLVNGAFKPSADETVTKGELTFGDLTMFYNKNDRIYSNTASNSYHKFQDNGTIPTQGAYNYGDYIAAGEWYCNGAGGTGQRYVTIKNVVAGDVLCAYVGVSNVAENFKIEYCGADGTQEGVVEATESVAKDANKKIMFIAKHSGVYKIWTEDVKPEGATAAGKPLYNRIVRYPAVGVQGTIDWAGISSKGFSVQFVNNTTKEVTNAVFDSTGYAVILAPGYTYTVKLEGSGNDRYAFTEDCSTIKVNNTDGINGKTYNLVVQDLEALHAVSGKFIGSGEVPLSGVNATKLVFKNIDNNDTYEAQIADDAYSAALKTGTYIAEITAENYSTRTHVIVKNAEVKRDLFLASTDATPLTLVKDLYVGYPDKEENNFPTINAALRAAKRMNPESEKDRITVHIYPGIYREQVFVNANYITLVNDSSGEDVVITWYYGIGYAYYSVDETGYYNEESAYDKYEKHNANRWGCAVRVKATDFKAKNIIFENSFNRYMTAEEIADGVTLSTAGTDSKIAFVRKATTTEKEIAGKNATERAAALALDTGSDRAEFLNCQFYSSQDTLYTGNGTSRAYYKNCLISGNTDYIFGDGNQVFQDCELQWQGYTEGANGGHITAAKDASTWGYLFYNCAITKNKTSGYTVVAGTLGRTWGAKAKVTYVNTVQETNNIIAASGWENMNGDPKNANYVEYNTTSMDGNAISYKDSPRKDIRTTTYPVKNVKYYFGNWTPTFYVEGSIEGTAPEPSEPESGSETDPSEPESGSENPPSESESTPESSETDSSGNISGKGICITGLIESYEYTGAKITPNIEVRDYDRDHINGEILVPGIDYTIKYSNNTKPTVESNPALITVTGKGNYKGKNVTATFLIKEAENIAEGILPADVKGAKIDKIPNQVYTGEAQYPPFTFTLRGGLAVEYKYNKEKHIYEAADKTPIAANVAVSNNVNKGTATILITGAPDAKNKPTTVKKTFKITAVDLKNAQEQDIVITRSDDAEYAVKGAVPKTLIVAYKGTVLKNGKDYTVKYTNNKKAGQQASITITGKGNYTGKCNPVLYTVKKLDLSKTHVKAVTACDGLQKKKVKATVVDGNGTALKASQYTLKIYKVVETDGKKTVGEAYADTDILEPGSIYVQAEARDTVNLENATDLINKKEKSEFSVGISIAKAKIALVKDNSGKVITKVYTGSKVELKDAELIVTISGVSDPLKPGEDYVIASYENNVNKGTATAVVKGIGKYSGTKTVKFKITQKEMVQGEAMKIIHILKKLMSDKTK